MNNMISEYSQIVGISEDSLLGKSRGRPLPTARQVHWLCMINAGFSYEKIGMLYDRHYTTILEGVQNVKNMIETRDSLIAPYLQIIDHFTATRDEALLSAAGVDMTTPSISE